MEMEQETDKLYYSIGEVAARFKLNESTLRFWEKEFDIITPRKTANGTRFYTKEDIGNIGLIYHLLKEKGMTLAGAKKKIKENKDTTVKNHEVIARLKEIRAELLAIQEQLG
ncbi:MAG: MerR family transcriptional regulator [Bacteroidales bacterium]